MKKVKKIKKKAFLSAGVFLLSIFVLSPLVFLASFYLAFSNKIYPGVSVDGVQIGNMTIDEAAALVSGLEKKTPFDLVLKTEGKAWKINTGDVSYHIRARETANLAYEYGRSGNFKKDIFDIFMGIKNGATLPLDYLVDEKTLENKISLIFTEVFSPAIDPKIEVMTDAKTGNKVINAIPGQTGAELDKDKALDLIKKRLAGFDFSEISLPVHPINPVFGSAQVEKTRQRAEKLLGKKLTFVFEDYSWNLGDLELIDFLSFDGTYSSQKLASFATSISTSIERVPQNAAFQFTNNKVTLFRPAVYGVTLDIDKFIENTVDALETVEKNDSNMTVPIPIKKTNPQITTESVNNLGINELIGRGTSFFAGSIQGRIHNVVLASSKISGALIKPGETFSFNKTLGDVSAATGFEQAYIIKEGRTVLGDGGGVCQVSTTLFRAALNAGLPIEERWPHSYRVGYYEQGGFGPGLDATVFDPSYDFKIRNDTPGYVLIQAYTDTTALKLTFDLYGTSDGRVSTITKPKIWSETSPPPDLYQDDPTLPAGTVKQVDFKAWGAKVSFDYKVTRNGEILQEKTFNTNYSPWRAIFLKGTRT